MADYDRRPRGGGGGYNNRKRRYREDDDYDRRPQRRRYEEPTPVRIRKLLLSIAESPLKRVEDEVLTLAKIVCDNIEDGDVRAAFLDLTLQIAVEQPFKIPFVAAVVTVLNGLGEGKCEGTVAEVLAMAAQETERYIAKGDWRGVKCLLKFLGCLQGVLVDEGVWPVLTELFERAVDLQTASSDDTLGTELVKVILFTIPYIMASSSTDSQEHAANLLEKTEIVAGAPHPLETLVDPYPGNGTDEALEPTSVLSLLQKQLVTEASNGWPLACMPKAWKIAADGDAEIPLETPSKHTLPPISVPETVTPGSKPLFPEIYFSVYASQDIETVPPTSDIASTLLRDSVVDTINILDFNRNAIARFLVDIDCYFSPGTFVKRATPFDRLREEGERGRSTWKPEDVAVDAVFSQLFQLPVPEHKLVCYHSVLTESCKIAPAAIAPSLGRAIRYLYKNVDQMDLELSYRFMDWFAHHLSNFGFTWKWTEWTDDVELPSLHPKKAFIQGALDKEIRLSFAQRIKGTLPAPYQPLISEAKEKDVPDFKYNTPDVLFAPEALEILSLLRRKAPETEIDPIIAQIHTQAQTVSLPPLTSSTDVYMTAICFIGSKSLSHVLSCIERCKERLLSIGATDERARRQIIESVMAYWADQPGVGVNIVDKLLNYTILTPASVLEWALDPESSESNLSESWIFEMVGATVQKVTNRVRQIIAAANVAGLPADQRALLNETLIRETGVMKEVFRVLEGFLVARETRKQGEDGEQGKQWAKRWLRVFRRKLAAEEAFLLEAENSVPEGVANGSMEDAVGNGNGHQMDIEADV